MLSAQIEPPAEIWRRLNLAWTAFFIVIGGINLYVAFHFEESVWVNFKLFGMLGLTVLFVLLQSFYLARHMPDSATEEK